MSVDINLSELCLDNCRQGNLSRVSYLEIKWMMQWQVSCSQVFSCICYRAFWEELEFNNFGPILEGSGSMCVLSRSVVSKFL